MNSNAYTFFDAEYHVQLSTPIVCLPTQALLYAENNGMPESVCFYFSECKKLKTHTPHRIQRQLVAPWRNSVLEVILYSILVSGPDVGGVAGHLSYNVGGHACLRALDWSREGAPERYLGLDIFGLKFVRRLGFQLCARANADPISSRKRDIPFPT